MGSERIGTQDTTSVIEQLEAERSYWQGAPGVHIDAVTEAALGSFWGRRWTDYDVILHHNGAPNTILKMFDRGQLAPSIVDAGCAAGVALADLRRYMPDAKLYGVDVRNASCWTISDTATGLSTTGRQWFFEHHIDFFQDSYHAIPDIIPPYDVLFCVGAMPDLSSSLEKQFYVLKQFYEGLTVGGYAQVLMQSSEERLPQISNLLLTGGIDLQFTPADTQVLKNNFFDAATGIWGTVTLGPKE